MGLYDSAGCRAASFLLRHSEGHGDRTGWVLQWAYRAGEAREIKSILLVIRYLYAFGTRKLDCELIPGVPSACCRWREGARREVCTGELRRREWLPSIFAIRAVIWVTLLFLVVSCLQSENETVAALKDSSQLRSLKILRIISDYARINTVHIEFKL